MIKRLLPALLMLPALAWAQPPDYQHAYSDCLERAGGATNGSVDACSSSVSADAKAEMIRLYRSIYRDLATDDPDDAATLDRAQKAWLVYRDLHCNLAGSHVGSPMYAFCPMQLNIRRVDELRELAGQ